MLVQTKHLMTAVWIQSSAILFTTELNKLFQKRQKNCHSQLQNKHFNNSSFVSQSSDSFVPKLRRYRCEKPEAASSTCCFAHFCIPRTGHLKSRLCVYFYTLPWSNNNNNNSSRRPKPMNGTLQAVWPDWVIYWTMGNFLKPWQQLICPNLPHY